MSPLARETFLSVVLLGLGVYFSVLVTRSALAYLTFRRVRPTALLTWPVRPAHFQFLLALGAASAAIAVLNGLMGRPLHHVLSQAIMACYFILMVPLSTRIHLGFYRDGVWADGGFLPYAEIGRLAFRETPEIVLILLTRGGGSRRLLVPPAEYGAVRKVLEEKIRSHVLNIEAGLLGL